jgi:hypothetical protein
MVLYCAPQYEDFALVFRRRIDPAQVLGKPWPGSCVGPLGIRR